MCLLFLNFIFTLLLYYVDFAQWKVLLFLQQAEAGRRRGHEVMGGKVLSLLTAIRRTIELQLVHGPNIQTTVKNVRVVTHRYSFPIGRTLLS